MLRTRLVALVVAACLIPGFASAEPRPSIALHGSPALGDGFQHVPYANPNALKGGRVTFGVQGSFDTLNSLIVKGQTAAGIREFSIESLMARGLDEPFTLYGLIASTIDVAADNASVTFALNPKAHFSDGTPLSTDDVLHSFELLKTKGRPNHRTYFAKVTKAESRLPGHVTFTFENGNDRELPLILALMPVVSKAATPEAVFDQTSFKPLIGSGAYTITNVDAGRSLTYTRDETYWGRDLPVNVGRFNFGEIRFDYYRDGSVMLEAFKQGRIDLRLEEDPGRWGEAYDVPASREGRVVKREFDIGLPAGMNGLAFNTRRAMFADVRVRRALVLLFDGPWINRTLYNGLFKRTESYFERSYLSSAGRPADDAERALLAAFPNAVRPDIMDGTYRLPESDGTGQNRVNQRAALALLKDAGYSYNGGRMINTATGTPLSFEILANNSAQEALLLSFIRGLEPLGISAKVRVADSAQYQRRINDFDYDMIQATWVSSLSPGNEQLFRWSAATADTKGSFNFAGVRDPAADAMITAMLSSKTETEFVPAVRALDRVLRSGDYVIPLFHGPKQWVSYWTRLKHPEKTPIYGYSIDTWWIEEPK